MAARYQLITELYHRTGVTVVKNPQAWQNFLSSACYNYKCRFDEQLLIYAQRPEATAVLELENWNKKFNRWVNKDSRGIAVFDTKGRRNTLKYYFDISDTHEGYYNNRHVPIWHMNDKYEQEVIERLSDRFGDIEGVALGEALIQVAENAVEDNLPDYLSQLRGYTKDSFLEELDDLNVEVLYRRLAANSVAFMLISRCGLDTEDYFSAEDFADIMNFNTPDTLNAIGIATSDISEMALREISLAIRNVQMEAKGQKRTFAQTPQAAYDNDRIQPERSNDNERNHLHQTGGLPYSRPHITDRARASAWQIRNDAQGLSGAAQAGDVPQPTDIGQVERSSAPDRADRNSEVGASDEAALSRAGRNGGTERERRNALGGADAKHPQSGRGNDTDRADLQLSIANEDEVRANLLTVDEQIERMVEAEEEKSSAFSVSQEDIDSVLQKGSGFVEGKYRIYRQFQKHEDSKKNIAFLKKEYGIGGGTHIFPDSFHGNTWHDGKGIAIDRNGSYTNHDLVLSWAKVEKRLHELIRNDRYLNAKEREHYPDYLESKTAPQYEIDTQRKMARQRFIGEHRDLAPADKRDTLSLRLSDFIRDLDGYEKDLLSNFGRFDLADVTTEQMEQHLKDPVTVQQLIDFLGLVQGKTGDAYSRSNAWKFGEELKELHPMHYLFQEGDIIYIGADKYEISNFNESAVSLQNVDFPLFGKEYSRVDFEEKLKENTANDHLKMVVTEMQNQETTEVYPAEENGLPYDIVVEKIRFDEPEQNPMRETPAHFDERKNFRITDDTLGIGGAKEKFRANMSAIHLLHDLEIENRIATSEEQETLSNYVGWGGLSAAFDGNNGAWANEYKELKGVLSTEEYRAAMESTLTAFYTPPVVIRAMYEVLDRMGFTQGNILEPSCGTGNFFGLLPDSMRDSKLHGIENDPLTGRIAKQLYQKASIAIQGFEDTKLPDDHFDVVLGNVPFGEFKVNDSRYNAQKFLIHDYFFAKALDKVRAGGIVMFLTSKGTMDKTSPEVRKYIAQRAELLGAIRLPDNTFRANAGTEVTSDIILLQKRDRVIDIELSHGLRADWVHLDTNENGITMNRYFVEHPEMIMGDMVMESTRFGMDTACKAKKNILLSELLSEAVQQINGEIPEYEIDEISDVESTTIPADPNVRNFSFTIVNEKVYFRENDSMAPATVSMTAENRIKGLVEIRDCVRRLIAYQTEDYPEEMIRTEQENLNRLYDTFGAKYGLINSRGNYLAFASDESYFLLCSLEVLDDEGNFKKKADMFSKRTIKPHQV